jgi:hypothetical protein
MEKIEITISAKKPVFFDYGTMTNIMVIPYISINNKRKIAEAYIASFFEEGKPGEFTLNEIQAEYALILATVDLCTNLSVEFSEDFIKFDNLIASGLWDSIKDKILNYKEFREQLSDMVKHIREDIAVEKSLGVVLDKVFSSIAPLIEKLSIADISDASIEKASNAMMSKIDEFQKTLEESSVKATSKPRKKRVSKKEQI